MATPISRARIAFVHDWLTTYAGAERVLEQMLDCYPHADLFSTVNFLPSNQRAFIRGRQTQTSFIQNLPFAQKHYRAYLPLMPLAVEQFDLSSYELVISSSYAVAKGVLTGPHQLHLCMCYSPIRYAWDLQHQYLRESGLTSGLRGWAAKWLLHRMRLWDLRTSNGVDQFIAISHFIRQRIWKVYRRESTVIYPPVDINAFSLETIKGEYYLTASRMVPYKRIGLIVRAFSQLPDRQLIVIGEGPDFEKIKRHAPPNVKMLGYQPFSVLKHHMQHARAFIFAAEEDFGIVPIEAQACGTPVIAYGRGGSRETVEEDKTGVFFNTQTPEAIVEALNRFETCLEKFDPLYIRKHTENFSASRFRNEFCAFVERAWENALI